MEQWLDVQTLIWLFPIMFILHDFEEIIFIEKWIKKNTDVIYAKLPRKIADNMIKRFSMSTAQFSVAVLVIFLFISSSTFMASQYVNRGPLANIYLFTVCILVFFLHLFTHVGQSIFFRSVTPGVITSIIVILPYSLILFRALFETDIITWTTVFISLPFVLFIFPIVFVAHWLGKKVV